MIIIFLFKKKSINSYINKLKNKITITSVNFLTNLSI